MPVVVLSGAAERNRADGRDNGVRSTGPEPRAGFPAWEI